MKLSKQELKYQANQQLSSKFPGVSNTRWWCFDHIDHSQLLKKVVK